jgi:hypothetical protein
VSTPGVSSRFVETVRNKRFKVTGSKAEDVDDSLVANAVRLCGEWTGSSCAVVTATKSPRAVAPVHWSQGWHHGGTNVLQSGTSPRCDFELIEGDSSKQGRSVDRTAPRVTQKRSRKETVCEGGCERL